MAPDKWKHFLVGIVMGVVLQIFMQYILPGHFILAISITFIIVAVVSYGFELYSLFTGKGHYDILDAFAGIAGGVVGIAVVLLFL